MAYQLALLAALAFGYLLGSIPCGLILTRFAGTGDIRTIGSGNIGATNVLRTGHKGLAAATLLGDMLKGTVAVVVADAAGGRDPALAAALGVVLGHVFPVWLRFKGGKGVATYIGALLAVFWPAVLMLGAIWGLVAILTRYSSLAGLLSTGAVPAFLWWQAQNLPAVVFLLLTALVWVRHRDNISRLLSGTEGKIGSGRGTAG